MIDSSEKRNRRLASVKSAILICGPQFTRKPTILFFTLGLVQFASGNLAVLPAHSVFAVKLLQYSNSLFNPILYGQNFPEFRNAYVRMLCSAKSNDDSFRFGGRRVVNRKTFRTTLSTYKSYSSPLPSKSPQSSGTWNERRDQRSRVLQKDDILVCMVSGL